MTEKEIIKKLKFFSSVEVREGMARFGIKPAHVLGVQVPILRGLAKRIGKNQDLAQRLWNSGIHEAKILAGMVADAKLTGKKIMDKWVDDFDSWDVCDQTCMNLFCQSEIAFKKAAAWVKNKKEFIRRAGFALMACLAFKDKKSGDKEYMNFLPLIKKYAGDERNYVKKAANWALRQIGKRNVNLNRAAIKTAEEILRINSKSARWIARDALRELKSEAVQKRIKNK